MAGAKKVDTKKIDPFDVEALEKSLNDSATRVSTIWISFLVFSLYLLIAATTVTHRQLLLAEPVKLPVLNIDLPLWGFFFLAPILFVIFHAYVLLQVLLLARTASAYNEALDQNIQPGPDNSRVRQRLANTLFAQIFAGSPRERDGWLGWLLKAMAWITLAIAPVFILLAFQFAFLPYHSHFITWTHRSLVLAELATAFMLWPLAFDAQRDLTRTTLKLEFRQLKNFVRASVTFLAWPLIAGRNAALPQRLDRKRFGRFFALVVSASGSTILVLVSIFLATFPGEPHFNLLTGHPAFSTNCDRWIFQRFQSFDVRFDRLVVPGIDVVDDEKLAKITKATEEKQRNPYEGERTQSFRGRNLQCGSFGSADFRRTDFSAANLEGADLNGAELDGAILDDSLLNDASLGNAKLTYASMQRTSLRNADMTSANLSKAQSSNSQFQGADLSYAKLHGTFLTDSFFYATNLSNARLQGAILARAHLQGANLTGAELQGASLIDAKIQGATLSEADLGAANLRGAQMQGAVFNDSKLEAANFEYTSLWRASKGSCSASQVKSPQFEAVIDTNRAEEKDILVEAAPASIKAFIQEIISNTPDSERKNLQELLDSRLIKALAPETLADSEASWRNCAANALSQEIYYGRLAQYLIKLACANARNEYFGVEVVIDAKILDALFEDTPSSFARDLARGLLGMDRTACEGPIPLSDKLKAQLQNILSRPRTD